MKADSTQDPLAHVLAPLRALADADLGRRADAFQGPAPLPDAMRYAVLGGGKRIRQILCLAACDAVCGDPEPALAPAAAIELIHAYSLVHDDMPCMDDDDTRRGRPTVHKAFGEAIALLTGDALLTAAFAEIAGAGGLAPQVRVGCVAALARAAGSEGMVGGQVQDISVPDRSPDAFRAMHAAKTGALFVAACAMGGLAAGASADQQRALETFGEAIGEAFQIADDILDDAEPTSAHEEDVNLVALLGRTGALEALEQCTRRALDALAGFDARGDRLRAIAAAVSERVPRSDR